MSATAWLAGWFEARGHIIIDARDSINPKSGGVIRRDKFGVGISGPEKLTGMLMSMFPGTKIQSNREWRAYSDNACRFLQLVRPMLRVRGDEIDAALLFWGTMKNRSRGVSVSDEVRRKREDLAAKVKALRGRRLYYVAARDHAKGMRESFP
jgi:hypothetical protein